MTSRTFLAPVLALILWTFLVWVLLYIRRIPAMKAARMDPESMKSPNGAWKEALPIQAQAAAHNYNHLLEQPTLFYALMFYAALAGQISNWLLYAAWAYVALRVLHSFVQVSAGKVVLRFALFTLATLVLFGMLILVIV